jgi:hypothetical protein
MYEYRCDERRKGKAQGSTRLTYTGFRGGLEHLKNRKDRDEVNRRGLFIIRGKTRCLFIMKR